MGSPKMKRNKEHKKRKPWNASSKSCIFKIWRKFKAARITREMYEEMSREMLQSGFKYTADEIKVKIKNLTSKYRLELKNPMRSDWKHFKEVEEILNIPDQDNLLSSTSLFKNDEWSQSQMSLTLIKNEEDDEVITPESITDHHNVDIKAEEDYTSDDANMIDEGPLEGFQIAHVETNDPNEELNPDNIYTLFNKIKNSTELSLGEFKRATDLFEDSLKVNRQRNDLMQMYLQNSLKIQTEMLTLMKKLNRQLK